MFVTLIVLELNIFKKKLKKVIKISKIVTNGFRIAASDSVMCGYFCVEFIDFMLNDKILTDFTNLFSPSNFKKNNDIILKYFMNNFEK